MPKRSRLGRFNISQQRANEVLQSDSYVPADRALAVTDEYHLPRSNRFGRGQDDISQILQADGGYIPVDRSMSDSDDFHIPRSNRFGMMQDDLHQALVKSGGSYIPFGDGLPGSVSFASDALSAGKDSFIVDEGTASQVGKGSESFKDFFENMTPKKFVGLQALSTGLQTAGALESIGAQEKATLSRMQQEYNLDLEELEFQDWMGENLREIAQIDSMIEELKAMESQAGGPVQSQTFIRDPRSGVAL